ncbi:DUF2332 domain-containing protein [Aurantiacibacter sp. D1-12]|uniref:DUF2332 domain-containing protein n=1 Tax=Aurantiacibacter sp. D1-12 TaxID=2993658 RepID=UPI00237CA7ED|nr:DUF2332 domain-containing protein [Aurantiacibacter sp. D1-12]MDE1466269.1 DUF2332 domain-containing protein [Aurantiacibacter sp. D1-12]
MGEGRSKHGNVMDIANLEEAIAWQADHADGAGAPCTARMVRALLAVMETDTTVALRMTNWHGLSLQDAMPLRIAGGFHWLYLTGEELRLGDVYQGLITDQGQVDAIVSEAAQTFDHVLLPWFDTPPQTNEAGRSASIMAALMWLSGRLGPKFQLFEIGASAGINTMMDRFAFDLGGVKMGRAGSPMLIQPEWRGDAPPANPVDIESIAGCDLVPMDLSDPAQALRLKSYVWPDATERMVRMDAAIALASERAPDLVQQDAGVFVAEQLAKPQPEGVTRVLFHSIMWQYMPQETRDGITQAMELAGGVASTDKPLAWISLETNRATFRHECKVRYWPGGDEEVILAEAHPHGAWVEWLG